MVWAYPPCLPEVGHLFYDVGDTVIDFAFGQWIWEAHSLIAETLTRAELTGDSRAIALYDTTANLGWERVNGVIQDGFKYQRTIVDGSATAALQLMTEVLTADTGLDFIKRVNAGILERYRASGNPKLTPAAYRQILDAAAAGRTVDGRSPGDWLFSQPVTNTSGTPGQYLLVLPNRLFYEDDLFDFEVAAWSATGEPPDVRRGLCVETVPRSWRCI